MSETDFVKELRERFPELTPTGKRIAHFLIENVGLLPFETADSIAQHAGTTGISVGRFLRSIGYQNLDDLKQTLRNELSPSWLMTDRLGAFRQEAGLADALDRSLARELDAIQHVYGLARTEVFAKVAEKIAKADAVFILGIQSTRGILNAFFSHLEYIRPHVYYADGLSGTYVESLNSEFNSPYVILSDFRAYSSITRKYCAAACSRNIEMVLVTDFHCYWARDYPIDLLQVKTDVGQFWDSLAPLSCLFNLIVSSVVDHLGPSLEERLAKNKQLQNDLGQFEL